MYEDTSLRNPFSLPPSLPPPLLPLSHPLQVTANYEQLKNNKKEQETELNELRHNKELLSQWEQQVADIIQWVTEEKDARAYLQSMAKKLADDVEGLKTTAGTLNRVRTHVHTVPCDMFMAVYTMYNVQCINMYIVRSHCIIFSLPFSVPPFFLPFLSPSFPPSLPLSLSPLSFPSSLPLSLPLSLPHSTLAQRGMDGATYSEEGQTGLARPPTQSPAGD